MPFTGVDLRSSAAICRQSLGPVADQDWAIPAHGLDWDCRYTLDHVCDCLAFYAHDLAGRIQVVEDVARDGFASTDPAELIWTVEILSEVLCLVDDGTPTDVRAFHPYGLARPEGFLAMACVEVLVHAWDVAQGLDLPMEPPAGIAPKLLHRLYRVAPTGHDAWQTVLYAFARIPLGELPHRHDGAWGWHVPPLAEWDGPPSPTRERL